jgi:hypothetical protein
MRKVKRVPELICTCGHYAYVHSYVCDGDGRCTASRFDSPLKQCQCVDFRLDNLLYLEELNEMSGMAHLND